MSMFDEGWTAVARPSLNTILGETVTYTPLGGAGVSTTIRVSKPAINEGDEELYNRMARREIRASIPIADVATPAYGDTFVINSVTHRVVAADLTESGKGETMVTAVEVDSVTVNVESVAHTTDGFMSSTTVWSAIATGVTGDLIPESTEDAESGRRLVETKFQFYAPYTQSGTASTVTKVLDYQRNAAARAEIRLVFGTRHFEIVSAMDIQETGRVIQMNVVERDVSWFE